MSYNYKVGDTTPPIEVELGIDLTDATVEFHFGDVEEDTFTIDTEAEIVDEEDGVVRYEWTDGDLDEPGEFEAEFITERNGRRKIFPRRGFYDISVARSLSGD